MPPIVAIYFTFIHLEN